MSCNQQQNTVPGSGALSNSRAPLSTTAGYSIQESRRRMLEAIDRRRNEMLNASNAAAATAAALARGPQIATIGSGSGMPRLQSASTLIRNYDQPQQTVPSSMTTDQQRLAIAAMNNSRRNGVVSSFPTANGGSFTHMKFPPGRGGTQPAPSGAQQQMHNPNIPQQMPNSSSRSHHGLPGSLAAMPTGAMMRAYSTAMASASAGADRAAAAPNRYAPPNAIVQAAADSSMPSATRQSSRSRTNQQLQQQLLQQQQQQQQYYHQQQQHHHQQRSRAATTAANVPTAVTPMPPALPEIAVQPHPFFDHLDSVMQPTALLPLKFGQRLQTAELTFTLTQEQAEAVALTRTRHPITQRTEYGVQVQLRCFKIAPGAQTDCFPPGISLAVNKNQVTTLPPPTPTNKPNADPIRPGRPVNISGHCRISHAVLNRLTLSWLHDPNATGYCVTVGLVRALTAEHLTDRLLALNPIAFRDTQARVVELLGGGGSAEELCLTDLTASLRCPLSRGRIRIPARGTSCSHLQCFDAPTFLAMNERKPNWRCPCCDRPLSLGELRVDELFRGILAASAAALPVETVRFLPDGSWVPVTDSDSGTRAAASVSDSNAQGTTGASSGASEFIVDLTEDAADPAAAAKPVVVAQPPQQPPLQGVKPAAAADPVAKRPAADSCGPDGILVITLDSSDDEADEANEPDALPAAPPAKRSKLADPPAEPASRSGGHSPIVDELTACWRYPGSSLLVQPSAEVLGSSTSYSGNPLAASFLAHRKSPTGFPSQPACGNRASSASPVVAAPAASGVAPPSPASSPHHPALDYAWGAAGNPDSIPLPHAFLQDQHRLSALLAATVYQQPQHQHHHQHPFNPAQY